MNLKHLLTTGTLLILWSMVYPSSMLAALKPSYYLPKVNACAVYRGNIDNEKAFTFWVETQRNLTIKADNSLQVAVVLGGKVVAPYQVAALPNLETSQFTYRTSRTGEHTILVRGIIPQAHITICLN